MRNLSLSWATQVPFDDIRCAEIEMRFGVLDWNQVPRHSSSNVHSPAPNWRIENRNEVRSDWLESNFMPDVYESSPKKLKTFGHMVYDL